MRLLMTGRLPKTVSSASGPSWTATSNSDRIKFGRFEKYPVHDMPVHGMPVSRYASSRYASFTICQFTMWPVHDVAGSRNGQFKFGAAQGTIGTNWSIASV